LQIDERLAAAVLIETSAVATRDDAGCIEIPDA